MNEQPFAFVVHRLRETWFAWAWEFPFFVGHGESSEEAMNNARALLDKELDRRETVDSQWKFKPHQWPPLLLALRERVWRDRDRRQLPFQVRTYEEWLGGVPHRFPPHLLLVDPSDSDLMDRALAWVNLIEKGNLAEAIDCIPDSTRYLPMSDFPKLHIPWTSEYLHAILAEAEIGLPCSMRISSGRNLVRHDRPSTLREIGQSLVCGLGRVVVTLSMRIAIANSQYSLRVEMEAFETECGLLLTMRRPTLIREE
jgi:hypothetical protein